ncbi:MAG: porin family protein [Flavobacterium sp.]|jgi:hypothetical protein|uniref:porin family protein n=1 Tax=Flavobacterium sp. TaxID=239 RepID=UPI003BA410D7
MKNAIIMIAMLAFSTAVVKAQSTDSIDHRNKFAFGIKAGVNLSNVYDEEGEDFVADDRYGWVAGAFGTIPFGKLFGLQPEILYSQKGFKSSGTFLGATYELSRKTEFIDLPFFVAIKPIEYVTILVGPQFSFLLKQTDEFKSNNLTSTQIEEFDNSNLLKNIIGLSAGADINLDHFVIGVRFGGDLKKNDGDGNSSTPRYKNMWYQATVGYKF